MNKDISDNKGEIFTLKTKVLEIDPVKLSVTKLETDTKTNTDDLTTVKSDT